MDQAVSAANRMAVSWARVIDDRSTVFSAACAWPLLALLSVAADGPARLELETAVGVSTQEADRLALSLLSTLDSAPELKTALGLWNHADFPLTNWWRELLPAHTRGSLTGDPGQDQPVLDEWVKDRTAGLLPRMPVRVDEQTKLILASALTVRTSWKHPFEDARLRPKTGPWAGGVLNGLKLDQADLSTVSLMDTPAGLLTRVRVEGDGEVDVHLILGEPWMPANVVLPSALPWLDTPGRQASTWNLDESAPGVQVTEIFSGSPETTLNLRTARFEVRGSHDLLAEPTVFGLHTATDTSRGHFPLMSIRPLAINGARQDAMARFTAIGFEAAAITGIAYALGFAMPAESHRARRIEVTLDRPFGFVAVHRPTGLILVAGWVADPQPYDEGEDLS